MRLSSVLGCIVVAAALLAAATAGATVVAAASVAQLADEATVVVHGIVREVDDSGSRAPFRTVVDLEVREAIKGLDAGARTFRFDLPGGRSGELAAFVPGMPRFTPGDEVVLLLERGPGGRYALAGLGQGVFRVVRGAGAARARRDLSGATYVAERTLAAPPDELEELLALLRAHAGAQR